MYIHRKKSSTTTEYFIIRLYNCSRKLILTYTCLYNFNEAREEPSAKESGRVVPLSSLGLRPNVLPAIFNINSVATRRCESSRLQICARNRNKRSVSFMKSAQVARFADQRRGATGEGFEVNISLFPFPFPPNGDNFKGR